MTHGLRSVGRREGDFSRLAMTMTPNEGKRFQIFDVLMKIHSEKNVETLPRRLLELMVPEAGAGTVMRSLSKEHR